MIIIIIVIIIFFFLFVCYNSLDLILQQKTQHIFWGNIFSFHDNNRSYIQSFNLYLQVSDYLYQFGILPPENTETGTAFWDLLAMLVTKQRCYI